MVANILIFLKYSFPKLKTGDRFYIVVGTQPVRVFCTVCARFGIVASAIIWLLVRNYLKTTFQKRWIGRGRPNKWLLKPSKSSQQYKKTCKKESEMHFVTSHLTYCKEWWDRLALASVCVFKSRKTYRTFTNSLSAFITLFASAICIDANLYLCFGKG